MTGSGAMLAETLHSAADCGNQLLLLLGVRRSRRPPDAMHPLGYGRALFELKRDQAASEQRVAG
jgi:divalent metal cation (Fe/Co/Zn/Cd) transporter